MLSHFRHLFARLIAAVTVVGGLGVASGAAGAATTTAPAAGACTSLQATQSNGGPAYFLIESDGAVVSCGGAPLHGSRADDKSSAAFVAGAATPAGGGYWLVSANGAVYTFGNARFFGSLARLRLRAPIVAFAATPDGGGYWLISANGNLFHYGDAGFYGSTVRDHKDGNVVALLPTPDGKGYWVVLSSGVVDHFGDAPPVGSLSRRHLQVVAAAANPDGLGLVLLTSDGGVHNLGRAGFYGSLVHRRLSRPLISIATSADGAGYLLTSAAGNVFNFGDAAFEGSLAATPPKRPTMVVDLVPVTIPAPVVLTSTPVAPTSLLPHGAFGYDISNFQCASPGSSSASPALPASAPFSVIEVAGWLDNSDNSCLAAETAWATAAAGPSGSHYSLYLFLNAPDQSSGASALDANGPAGQCAALASSAQATCFAYNYGYEGAASAFSYASKAGVSSPLWWLDVEGSNLSPNEWSNFNAGEYWSSSTALNAATIEGAIDALRADGATVGVYSTSSQFAAIASTFVPSGAQVPLWIAGAALTNPPYSENGLAAPTVLGEWCGGTPSGSSSGSSDLFAGGVAWLLQETPGSVASLYGIDPDYAC